MVFAISVAKEAPYVMLRRSEHFVRNRRVPSVLAYGLSLVNFCESRKEGTWVDT